MGKQSLSERKKLLLEKFESIKKAQVTETIFLISAQNGKIIQINTKLNKEFHGILFGEFIAFGIWEEKNIYLCVGVGTPNASNELFLWFLEEDGNGIVFFRSIDPIKKFEDLKKISPAVFV